MARPKGIPKTGGRQKGTLNKRTRELEAKVGEAAVKIAAVLGCGAFDGDAHAYLMSVYKDTTQPAMLRLDAAKAAAPFEKPKLASVDNKLSGTLGYTPIVVSERDPINPVDSTKRPAANGHSPASRH